MRELAAETAAARLAGRRPGRTRSALTAAAAGIGVGALVYKVLRSGSAAPSAG